MQKTSLSICSAILALTCIGASAQSRNGMYVEADYSKVNFKLSNVAPSPDFTVKPDLYKFIVGAEVHPNLAIEGMLAIGGSSDTSTQFISGTPLSLSVKVKNTYGVFLKPKFNVTDDLELFGRIGYDRVSFDSTVAVPGTSLSGSSSRNSAAYGIGAKYNFTPEWSAVVDYMQYTNKDNITINGVSVGVAYKF